MNLSPATEARLDAMPDETKLKLSGIVDNITGASGFLLVSRTEIFKTLAAVTQAELSALRTPHQLGTLLISKLGPSLLFPAHLLEEAMTRADASAPNARIDFSEFTLLRELVEDTLHPQAA